MDTAEPVGKARFWVAALLVPLLLPDAGTAQLREVDQTVFGMDCSPCAYALEKRIKRMDGVRSVSVSLDRGLARIEFKPDHVTTLGAVRSAVAESGFSPEDAAVKVRGILQKEEDTWLLLAEGERFVLAEFPPEVQACSVMTVAGRVPKKKDSGTDAWMLHLIPDLR